MVLPLRFSLDERAGEAASLHLAHTIDISPIGGRLGGLRTELSPGQTITLLRGQQKAAFRVVWSKHLSTHENQAGIEAIEMGRNIWGVDLPQSAITQRFSERPAKADQTAAAQVVSPEPSRAHTPGTHRPRMLIPSVIPRKVLWGLSFGLFLLSGLLGLSIYHEILNDTGKLAIQIPAPVPPTAAELARMTPKPREIVTPAMPTPSDRVQVAEAPTGRIVYPVAPEDSLGGKVRLQIVIAANGLVKQIHVLSGRQVLAEAAAQAVRLWHYRPFHSDDGPPAERETTVVVSFRGTDAVSLEFPSSRSKSQIRVN